MGTNMSGYLVGIAVGAALLGIDSFGLVELGGFGNGIALLVVVFAILALAANAKNKQSKP